MRGPWAPETKEFGTKECGIEAVPHSVGPGNAEAIQHVLPVPIRIAQESVLVWRIRGGRD